MQNNIELPAENDAFIAQLSNDIANFPEWLRQQLARDAGDDTSAQGQGKANGEGKSDGKRLINRKEYVASRLFKLQIML